MRLKITVIAFIASLIFLSSCSEETCPVAMKSDAHYFKRKSMAPKVKSRKKPTPSLIHVTRVNYKPKAFQ